MKQLYDQLDENGSIVNSNILLVPGLKLPEGHTWIEHKITLEEAKAEKLAYIETTKNINCFKPVSAVGYLWQVDTRSQNLISSAILLSELGVVPVPPTWRTLDNVDVAITVTELKAIAAAAAYQTSMSYAKSWELKALVNTATTVEEVNAIEWI
jgi:hypothetical protein